MSRQNQPSRRRTLTNRPDHGLLRLRLDLAYDGTEFAGWARQPGQRTVEQELTRALTTVLRLSPEPRLQVAGRTDAGVHATGQVAHTDVPEPVWSMARPEIAIRRLAGVLPADIRVFRLQPASAGFDARFSGMWRRYRYRISDRPGGVCPLRRTDTVAWPRSLDVEAMMSAGAGLIGLHDFAAFCRARTGATTVRHLQNLAVVRTADAVVVDMVADAFCHSMVRSVVGALLTVGDGRRSVSWPPLLLGLGHRADQVPVAPAGGLTLVEVGYPSPDKYGARADQTRALRQPVPMVLPQRAGDQQP